MYGLDEFDQDVMSELSKIIFFEKINLDKIDVYISNLENLLEGGRIFNILPENKYTNIFEVNYFVPFVYSIIFGLVYLLAVVLNRNKLNFK